MNEYTLAWGVYLAGCLALLLVGGRITRRWPRLLRHWVLATAGVWLVTPFSLQLDTSAYAPALFILVFNTLFQGWETALDAASTLLVVWLTALVLALVYVLLTRSRKAPADTREQKAAE